VITFCTCSKRGNKRRNIIDPLCYYSSDSTNNNIGYNRYDTLLDKLSRYDVNYSPRNAERVRYWISNTRTNPYINVFLNNVIKISTSVLQQLDMKHNIQFCDVFNANKSVITSVLLSRMIHGFSAVRITKDDLDTEFGNTNSENNSDSRENIDNDGNETTVNRIIEKLNNQNKSRHIYRMEDVTEEVRKCCHSTYRGDLHFNESYSKYLKRVNERLINADFEPMSQSEAPRVVDILTNIYYINSEYATPPCIVVAHLIEMLKLIENNSTRRDTYNSKASFLEQHSTPIEVLHSMGLNEADVITNDGNNSNIEKFLSILESAAKVIRNTSDGNNGVSIGDTLPEIEQQIALIRRVSFEKDIKPIQTAQLNCDNMLTKLYDNILKTIYGILGIPAINNITNAYNSERESVLHRSATISTLNEYVSTIIHILSHALDVEDTTKRRIMADINNTLNDILLPEELRLEIAKNTQ